MGSVSFGASFPTSFRGAVSLLLFSSATVIILSYPIDSCHCNLRLLAGILEEVLHCNYQEDHFSSIYPAACQPQVAVSSSLGPGGTFVISRIAVVHLISVREALSLQTHNEKRGLTCRTLTRSVVVLGFNWTGITTVGYLFNLV